MVGDFKHACKKEYANKLSTYSIAQITFSLADGGEALESDDPLPAQNTAESPLYIANFREPYYSPKATCRPIDGKYPSGIITAVHDIVHSLKDLVRNIEEATEELRDLNARNQGK
jgi:hypothetical protein